jgi:uncharacterized membrane protein HdeD (DUF308 family)
MKFVTILGAILIVVGIFALVVPGISFTEEKATVDLGPIEGTVKEKETIPLPAVAGGASLAAGVVLVFFGMKSRKRR